MATYHGLRPQTLETTTDALPMSEQDTISPGSARKALEGIIVLTRHLAADPELEHVLEHFDRIPDLEKLVKRKDQTLVQLRSDLERTESAHEAAKQEWLQTYDVKYKKIEAVRERAQSEANHVRAQLSEKEKAKEVLVAEKTTLADEIVQLKETIRLKTEDAEKAREMVGGLREAMRNSREANEQAQSTIQQLETWRKQAQAEIDLLQKSSQASQTRATRAERRLAEIDSLSVPLDDALPIRAIERLESLWVEASLLISSTFSQNLSREQLLDNDQWGALRNPNRWTHSIPLPQSNSRAAFQKRCVVVMGSFARAVAHHVLQPTYLFPGADRIGRVLTRQAGENSGKESAIRAMLHGMLPNDQDALASAAVDRACNEVVAFSRGLLPSEGNEFQTGVRALIEEACAIWREIGRSAFAIEPSFVDHNYEDGTWNELSFEADKPVIKQQQRTGVEQNGALVVIFPRLFVYDEDGRDPETPGVILMRSQARMAREEVERSPPSPDSERSTSFLSRRTRTLSTEARSDPATSAPQSFLGC